jgi:hypothetical protein
MRHLAAAFLLAALARVPPAAAAPLAAHHAVYRLTLDHAKDQDVSEAQGTMTYDVVDGCTAWTTSQHLVIDLTNKDGQDVHMVSDYATYETKDGLHLDFHTKQVTEQAVTEQLDGTAVLDRPGGPGRATFTSPEAKQVALPGGTLLPMAHTAALLDAAAAGRRFLAVPLFDGTGADGAQDTFVTVESWRGPGQAAPAPGAAGQKWAALAALPSGRVHIAFFSRAGHAQTPDYEIGMQYYANGVADGLAMDFGDFVMDGRLTALDMHPAHC